MNSLKMKYYLSMYFLLFLIMNDDLSGQISAESEIDIQLNVIDTLISNKSIVADRNGILYLSDDNQDSEPEANISLPLSNDYNDYGFQYEGGSYYKHNNRVHLGGLIRKVTGTFRIEDNDMIAILPKEYRPSKNIYPRATQNGNTVSLIIYPSGEIRVFSGGDAVHDFLSLDGISFYRADQVGDYIEGGYLFYVANPLEDLDGDGDLDKGLIAAEVHTGTSSWGCDGIDINSDSTLVGYGYINSALALDACNFQNEAVQICDDLILNGYDDWFMPSHDENVLIWENLVDWDGNGMNDGNSIGNFIPGIYWSSTEAGFINDYIRCISLNSGFANYAYPKTNVNYFRAIRVLDN